MLYKSHNITQRWLTVFSVCRYEACTTSVQQFLTCDISACSIAVDALQKVDFQQFPMKNLHQLVGNLSDATFSSSNQLTRSVILLQNTGNENDQFSRQYTTHVANHEHRLFIPNIHPYPIYNSVNMSNFFGILYIKTYVNGYFKPRYSLKHVCGHFWGHDAFVLTGYGNVTVTVRCLRKRRATAHG